MTKKGYMDREEKEPNEEENNSVDGDIKELSSYVEKLIEKLATVCEISSSGDIFKSDYSDQRTALLIHAKDKLSSVTSDYFTKLDSKDMNRLGELVWRCLRACVRFLEASKSIKSNIDLHRQKIYQEDLSRLRSEFNIIELVSSEILSFIEISLMVDDDRNKLSAILREARMAQEMYTQLIEKLDNIRGEANQAIMIAKEEAIRDSGTIKELISKSSNAYLAEDFSERKKANSIELFFWFTLMSLLLAVDAWLIWSFDLAAVNVWQNRLIDLGLIGFVATVAFWMGRNFRAAMHQRTILNQRITTLKTFQAFYDKVENQDLKDAVVLEASKTIFSHVSSGYGIDATVGSTPSVSDMVKVASLTKTTN